MTEDIILMDNVVYNIVNFDNEVQEFEPLVIEHIKDIFGKDAKFYLKRAIKTLANNRSIPDGFVIDVKNNKWYILELKLLCDDAINRISRQIVNYKNAVSNLRTKKEIYEAIDEPSQELYNIIYNTSPEIVIIIDSLYGEKGQQFEEQVLGTDRTINIIEFKTYAREHVEPDKVHIHLFRPLVSVKSEIKVRIEETKIVQEPDMKPSEQILDKQKPTRIQIENDTYDIKKSYDISLNTAEWLIKKGKLTREVCPIRSGHKRYLLNTEPKHLAGHDFRVPKELSNGLFIELHYSTTMHIRNARILLQACGYPKDILQIL